MVFIFFGRFCLYRSSIFVHAVPLQEEHVEAWNDWTQGKKHKKLNKGVKRKGWWADNQQAKRDWKAAKKEERRKEQEKYVLAIKDGEEEDGWEDHNHLLGSGKVPAPATPPLTYGATSSLEHPAPPPSGPPPENPGDESSSDSAPPASPLPKTKQNPPSPHTPEHAHQVPALARALMAAHEGRQVCFSTIKIKLQN